MRPSSQAAERHRYDIDRLCAEFGASVEQVAHRLTTLGRTGARGVPFFMLRVDAAGNISKRFAGESFPFSRFGGTCPRWNLHAAFQTPGPGRHPDRRDPRRPALLHHQPHRRARRPPRSARGQLSSPSASAATSSMRRGSPMPTASTSPSPPVTPIGPACVDLPARPLPPARRGAGGPHPGRQRDPEDDLALSVPGGLIDPR